MTTGGWSTSSGGRRDSQHRMELVGESGELVYRLPLLNRGTLEAVQRRRRRRCWSLSDDARWGESAEGHDERSHSENSDRLPPMTGRLRSLRSVREALQGCRLALRSAPFVSAPFVPALGAHHLLRTSCCREPSLLLSAAMRSLGCTDLVQFALIWCNRAISSDSHGDASTVPHPVSWTLSKPRL